jgi:hypothetical protein
MQPLRSGAFRGQRWTCWREGEGSVSDLIPGRSSGLRDLGQRPDDVEAVAGEVVRTGLQEAGKTTTAVYVNGQGVPHPRVAGAIARDDHEAGRLGGSAQGQGWAAGTGCGPVSEVGWRRGCADHQGASAGAQ